VFNIGVHQIQNFAIQPDLDPCRILTYRIRPDPNRILIIWIQPDPDPAGSGYKPDKRRKITLSAAQLEETGMTVYPVL